MGLSLVFRCLSWSVVKTCAIDSSRSFRSCHGLGVCRSLGSTHRARLVQCCTDLFVVLDSAVAGVPIGRCHVHLLKVAELQHTWIVRVLELKAVAEHFVHQLLEQKAAGMASMPNMSAIGASRLVAATPISNEHLRHSWAMGLLEMCSCILLGMTMCMESLFKSGSCCEGQRVLSREFPLRSAVHSANYISSAGAL